MDVEIAVGWPLMAVSLGLFIGSLVLVDSRRITHRTRRGNYTAWLIISAYACFISGMVLVSS